MRAYSIGLRMYTYDTKRRSDVGPQSQGLWRLLNQVLSQFPRSVLDIF
jgi:hypothetical protein